MSIFSPPRNKPKISIQQPTLAVGMPMPMVQTINRPVNLVDDEGNVHGRLGENPNGPEQVTVTPPRGPTNDPAGGPNYASGGTLLIGGRRGENSSIPIGYDGPNEGPQSTNPVVSAMGTGIFSPNWALPGETASPTVPTTWNPTPGWAKPVIIPPTGIQNPDPSLGANPANPNQVSWNLQNQQIQNQNAALDMKKRVIDARAQALGANSGVTQANQRVLDLRNTGNNMQRGVYQQQGQDEAIKLQELQSIYNASKNAPDILRTGEAKNLYNAEDRRASQMGVAPEAEVTLPPEYNGARQAGIRPKILTQEQRLAEKAGYEDPIRNTNLDIAKNAVALQSTDINAAELEAKRAGMTLDQANDAVKRAELDSDYASIITQRGALEQEQDKIPPFAGAEKYTNPQTGEGQWVTPWKAALYRKEDEKRLSNTGLANKYSDSPYYGAFSVSELEQMITQAAGTATNQGVTEELVKRGLTPQQAAAIVFDANARTPKKPGALSEVGGTSIPVTGTNVPAAAPNGANTAGKPPSVSVPPTLNPFR